MTSAVKKLLTHPLTHESRLLLTKSRYFAMT